MAGSLAVAELARCHHSRLVFVSGFILENQDHLRRLGIHGSPGHWLLRLPGLPRLVNTWPEASALRQQLGFDLSRPLQPLVW